MININESYKNPFTEYGRLVKIRLLEKGRSQKWLIDELKERTSMFVDSSVLNKVLTGRTSSPRLITEINKILSIDSKDNSITTTVL